MRISSAPWLALLLLALCARAGDWPQWRGPNRTGHVPAGCVVPASLPAEPKILWRAKAGDGFASPVVAADKVYFADNQDGQETVHAFAADSGKEIWHAAIDRAVGDHQGP